MAAKNIPEAEMLLKDLKISMKTLGDKILSQLPAFGFTPPQVQDLD